MYGMGSFDWSINIYVWNLSRNFWYACHFIHETFDTRIILYTELLIRVSFYARNFGYAYHFIHGTVDTRIVLYTTLFIRECFLSWNLFHTWNLWCFLSTLANHINFLSTRRGVHWGIPFRSCNGDVEFSDILRQHKFIYRRRDSNHRDQGLRLSTWFNFNNSMDK